MKSQTVTTVISTRCSHRTASGRQCRQLSADRQSGLCRHHRAVQKQKEADDLSPVLLSQSQGFQTAQGVNFALTNLYELLAANRISARRAAVLAYINSLLLRTLPAIDADNHAGITDPTSPKELPPDRSASPSEDSPAAAPEAIEASTWTTEPDLTKKPS
jgi:hypothetical protein